MNGRATANQAKLHVDESGGIIKVQCNKNLRKYVPLIEPASVMSHSEDAKQAMFVVSSALNEVYFLLNGCFCHDKTLYE